MTEARWRIVALLVAAGYAASRGVAYVGDVPSTLPGGLDLISTYLPLAFWATAWLAAALVALVALRFIRTERWAWGGLIGMMFVWAGAYLIGWGSSGFESREWLNAGSYGFPALLVLALTRAPIRRQVQPDTGRAP
jgi:hypothetical protein